MAKKEAQRCKGCKAPLLSAFEQERGKCTACLRKERMETAEVVVSSIKPAKQAKAKTPTMLTQDEPIVLTSVNIQPKGVLANSELIAFRVDKGTLAKLEAHLTQAKQAKAPYLRAILRKALGD